MDIISANNGVINGGLGTAFTVTLAAATTMNFQNFDLGTEFENHRETGLLRIAVRGDLACGSDVASWWTAGPECDCQRRRCV